MSAANLFYLSLANYIGNLGGKAYKTNNQRNVR